MEDKPTPVQARPKQEDGPRKGRQCQETSIPFYICAAYILYLSTGNSSRSLALFYAILNIPLLT